MGLGLGQRLCCEPYPSPSPSPYPYPYPPLPLACMQGLLGHRQMVESSARGGRAMYVLILY